MVLRVGPVRPAGTLLRTRVVRRTTAKRGPQHARLPATYRRFATLVSCDGAALAGPAAADLYHRSASKTGASVRCDFLYKFGIRHKYKAQRREPRPCV